MALKDKLMTLEDFKAVRDVDVASNQAQFTELNESIGALDTVSDPIKEALLDCFEHVALWEEGSGQTYIDELKSALGSIIPDLSTGTIISGYYDDTGAAVVTNSADYCNEKYFRIEEGTDYYWVQGYSGLVQKVNNAYRGRTIPYRVCYYDENKDFISREVSGFSTEWGYVEPRYFKLTIPNGARFFRVSWGLLPCGNIYKTIPTDVYAVTIVLANLNDSEIADSSDLQTKFQVLRGGKDITRLIKTGNLNADINDNINNVSGWIRNIFSVLQGGSPEYGDQNLDTLTRIHNIKSYLMRKGDVISFNNVKAGVRAERISDGSVQHSTQWITDNSDFVVGGES